MSSCVALMAPLREAFTDGLIDDHDAWRQMAKDRTLMSHTYDEQDAQRVVELIFMTTRR